MWKIQIYVDIGDCKEDWRDLKPSDSNFAYLFETKKEALRIMNMCYPKGNENTVRVVKDK